MSEPIKGNSFWVKTLTTSDKSEITLFYNEKEAVMSFDSMEEAITQEITIAKFTYDPKPEEGEANWTISPISWREIADARLKAKK